MLPSEEIKEKINIVDLINEYVPLKKAGVNFRAVCPFHQEKTPSFIVSPAKQIWHCFGCSLGGDIFEFIKQIEGVEFPEALEMLASRAGITLKRPTAEYKRETDQKKVLYEINELAAKFYAKVLSDSSRAAEARAYLANRGFKPETVQKWLLGYAPDDFHILEEFLVKKGYQRTEAEAAGVLAQKEGKLFDRFRDRIMFPLFDIHGRVVGFTARILPASPSQGGDTSGRERSLEAAKYINSPETLIYSKSRLLYGLHFAKTEIRKNNGVIVVEGNVDVITSHEASFTNVVGSSGTALTREQLEALKRFTDNISFAFDVDEAGIDAARRAVELALVLGFNVTMISIPNTLAKDPDEMIRKDPNLWQEQVKEARNFLDFYFSEVFAKIDLSSNSGKKQAVSQLLSLISLLPDPIDRSHYIHKLSQEAGIDEKIILDYLNRYLETTRRDKQSRPSYFIKTKNKREILERRVLGLFLKFIREPEAWRDLESEDFTTPVLRRIFERAISMVEEKKFEIENFKAENKEFASEIEILLFAVENELAALGEWNPEEVKRQFLLDFKHYVLRSKMQDLNMRIRQAERVGRLEEARLLSGEFNQLSRELNKYHAG